MTDDIAEQLRDIAFKKCGPTMEAVHTKLIEWKAADALEAQARRIAELEEQYANANAANLTFGEQAARIAELKAALKPFAAAQHPSDVSVSDLRAARAALGDK